MPAEEVARDVMSFELGESKQTDESMYFDRKAPPDRPEEYAGEMGAHKDLFETISEAHYLPELGGPHDEALLESLVEKGCEDNQILGQTLDKLTHLVHSSGEYTEEDEHLLLSNEPVSEIINRLEQTLESPGHSSITAAQGLLHLHHIGDHLNQAELRQDVEQTYMSEEVFVPDNTQQCGMETLSAATELHEVNDINHLEYVDEAEKRLAVDVGVSAEMYTDPVPDSIANYTENKPFEESQVHLPDQSEIDTLSEIPHEDPSLNKYPQNCENVEDRTENNLSDNIKEEEFKEEIPEQDSHVEFMKDGVHEPLPNDELVPTDLSLKNVENSLLLHNSEMDVSNLEDNASDKSDEQPRDLTVHRRQPTPHASPRRTDIPRAPSRESDAMQSPQPSGIPAVPSSPEIFTMPLTKSKQTLFLETLLSSPSPKMYTSEVTITKQQCEPLNLGKNRKSASPTVSSCSDEMRKLNKEFGEPQEKRLRRESTEELAKISKVFNKCSEEQLSKKADKHVNKTCEEMTPIKQFHILKSNPDFNIPDPLLIPKDKIKEILANPGTKIPALLIQRPELRLPEALVYPAILQDPDIILISLSQLERILIDEELQPSFLKANSTSSSNHKEKEAKPSSSSSKSSTSSKELANSSNPDQTSQPKPIPSMDALAGDIDAATSAALNQMLWLPYLSQLEAMAACSQNMDFLKALNSSGYSGQNYPDLSQMFNSSSRFMGPGGFPMMQPMDYDNRLQFAMWQEAMAHANASSSQRSKSASMTDQMKELSKSSDVQNPFVHSTKSHQSKPQSSARTSPIAHNYNNQRPMAHNPYMQGMYPGMNANIRPNMPLPGLQIPYFNPQMMGNQRSPRTPQQKSPNSPYYPNNNYLQALKQSEAHQRAQESPRPRISVKSLHNLLEPSAAAASGVSSRRASSTPTSAMSRRREDTEVGSTTPLGEPTPLMPPHPHDPSSFHLWHPLFGNQKSYNSPWSWTTVTATGD